MEFAGMPARPQESLDRARTAPIPRLDRRNATVGEVLGIPRDVRQAVGNGWSTNDERFPTNATDKLLIIR